METRNSLMAGTLTLRRDLYLVLNLLLADYKIVKIKEAAGWINDFYESEVYSIMRWTSVVLRNLLDAQEEKSGDFGQRPCGEYWADFKTGIKTTLTFRQACKAIIHAEELLPYKAPQRKSKRKLRRVYVDRITVRGPHKNKRTRAQIDIIQFVQTADALIDFMKEEDHANR